MAEINITQINTDIIDKTKGLYCSKTANSSRNMIEDNGIDCDDVGYFAPEGKTMGMNFSTEYELPDSAVYRR